MPNVNSGEVRALAMKASVRNIGLPRLVRTPARPASTLPGADRQSSASGVDSVHVDRRHRQPPAIDHALADLGFLASDSTAARRRRASCSGWLKAKSVARADLRMFSLSAAELRSV
ncbi:MAG: hypothetical protein U1E61_15735 [Bradyrhizobium sp.]